MRGWSYLKISFEKWSSLFVFFLRNISAFLTISHENRSLYLLLQYFFDIIKKYSIEEC